MPAAGVLGLGLLVALVGHLFTRALAPAERERTPGEVAFMQLFVGVVLCGWPAFILAEVGLFSLLRWSLLLLLGTGLLLATRWKAVRSWRGPALRWRGEGLLNLGLFLLLGFFLCFPGEWLLGGQDPGVYVATAASIAGSGGIVLHDPEIARMPAVARPLFLFSYIGQWWQLPGFYLTDFSGQVTPQFLHLYPVWLALGHAAGGPFGALCVTPLLVLLGLAAAFFLVRRRFGEWPARLALVLLALNPAQVWFARQPSAESLTLVLVLGGWYLLLRAAQEPGRWDLALFAGAALGEIALVKVEYLFLPLLICAWFLLRAWAGRPLPNG
ncbi:MAG: glycosyltransferase family 39 protein, partial [Chloroflexia bacterium]